MSESSAIAAPRGLPGRVAAMEHRTQYALCFFALTVIYLVTASYTEQSSDTVSMYYPAWQLAHHGNVTMDAFADEPLWWVPGTGDRIVSNRMPGATWLATPFYLLDNFSSSPGPVMGNLAAAFATAGAVTLLFALLRRIVPDRLAFGGAMITAFATPTWTVSGDALWTHGPDQLWLLLGVSLAATGHHLLSGLSFGAAVVTRPHTAVVAAAVGLWDLVRHRRLRPCALVGLGSAAGVVVLALYSRAVFASSDPRGGYADRSVALDGFSASVYVERVLGTLISPSRGIFVLTPFLLLLLPGLLRAWRAAPDWARAAAVGGTVYMLIQWRVNGFSGGYAFFSYRLPIEWLTMAAPLLALSYVAWTSRTRLRRLAFHALVLYSLATHAIGAILYRTEPTEPDYWRHWNVGEVVMRVPVSSALVGLAAFAVGTLLIRSLRPGSRLQGQLAHPAAGAPRDEASQRMTTSEAAE